MASTGSKPRQGTSATNTAAHLSGVACAACLVPNARFRCSQCQEKGVEVAFCSQEHQRAVWPVHKGVCGPKSRSCNPFLHVRLSSVEAREAKRDKLKIGIPGAENLPEDCTKTLQRSFERSGIYPWMFDATIDALSRPRDEWALPVTCPNSPFQIIRSTRYFRAQNLTGTPLFEPWPLLAQYENKLNTSGVRSCDMFSDLYPPLCHRALCFLAWMEKEHERMGDGNLWETYRDAQFRLLVKRLQDFVVEEGNPEVVPVIARAVNEAWMHMCGTW